jgi:PAS domain S-box-containing protein
MLEIGNSPTEVRRQKALLKAGALQNAIFNSANFSCIATDAKGVIHIFNVGAQRMLGYTAAEVMNKITPADISDPQEMIARAKALSVELGTPVTPGFEALVFKAARGIEDIYELTYIRKDGSRFPAMVSVSALRDANNTVIGYLLIGTDNTARQQAEAERREANLALRDREEKLAITLNSIGDAVIATDANAHVTLMNPVAEHLTGWTQQQALGRSVSDVLHIINKGNRQAVTIPVMAALAHGTVQGLANHTVLIALDGSECDIADSCAPIRNRDDAVIGAVLVFRDVTGDYAAQQALRDSSALIQTILNTVVDGIITLQAHHGVIETINPAAERMFGYQAKELIGQRFSLLIPELGRNPPHLLHGTFDDYRASEAERTMGKGREVLGRRKDGSTFPMEMAVSEMKLGGQRYFTGILRDVTARQRIETERALLAQALQEKNAELESAKSVAEKANLAKSDFLSSMSHELRTPLHAILGFAQLMESGVPPPTASQKTSIDQILQAGWYLLELINEILDIALIESGRLSISPEPMSLTAVLSDCQAMIEPQAQKRGIHVTFPATDGTCFVKADRTRVKQVFINLLSNAIKYNRPGGTVEVTCHAVPGERIRISFRDSGAGLSAEKLPQLFQPFNRLGQEASSEEGTGVGLVVSKKLVELMGGTIGAESIVGVGSVFWIELNAAPTPASAVHAAQAHESITEATTPVDAPRWTLLCVEDNPANLMLVEQLLARRSDICLLSAQNGSLGIEMARNLRPDIILMDIHLPGINGISALRILANDPATAHIPVIALSANAMQRDVQKGLAAGFFRYLTKPIKVNEFMDTLDAVLALRRAAPPATPATPPATSQEVTS